MQEGRRRKVRASHLVLLALTVEAGLSVADGVRSGKAAPGERFQRHTAAADLPLVEVFARRRKLPASMTGKCGGPRRARCSRAIRTILPLLLRRRNVQLEIRLDKIRRLLELRASF